MSDFSVILWMDVSVNIDGVLKQLEQFENTQWIKKNYNYVFCLAENVKSFEHSRHNVTLVKSNGLKFPQCAILLEVTNSEEVLMVHNVNEWIKKHNLETTDFSEYVRVSEKMRDLDIECLLEESFEGAGNFESGLQTFMDCLKA